MQKLNLYNTLTRKVEAITPTDGKTIRLYTCGPTVYNYVHIGNLRSYISADLLYRTLIFNGYNVDYAMNITDVDDKTIRSTIAEFGAGATVADLKVFTGRHLEAFLKDLDAVNIDASKIRMIRVSEVIPEIIDFIKQLIDKGYAYHTDDGVYFSIEKYQADFHDYGALVGEKFLEGKKVGARVAVDEYEKEDLSDFALWKAHSEEDGQIFWESEDLGKGRPGWHIECSVINKVAFGDNTIDIHTGGVDLVFPHHTNEIAQSQPLGPFVKHWMHPEHLQIADEKMAKSKNNFYTLRDIEEKGFSGLDLRCLYLQSHYKTQSNFTWEGLEGSKIALNKLKNMTGDEPVSITDTSINNEVIDAMKDNLNAPIAFAKAREHKDRLQVFDKIFGLRLSEKEEIEIPQKVQDLLNERETARNNKDFEQSDELRDEISKLGFEVKDTSEGQQLNKI